MDASPGPAVDVVHDISEIPWPFKGESFDRVYLHGVLEHLPWDNGRESAELLFRVVEEAWRVLRIRGVLDVSVPHEKSPGAWGIPFHRRVFNEFSFGYFVGYEGERAGLEARPGRPLFRAMRQWTDRRFQIGSLSHYHLRKYAPVLYRGMVAARIGPKDMLHVELTK